MLIPIFVEAGSSVGLGHLRRACFVAEELRKRRLDPVFFCDIPDSLVSQVPVSVPVEHWSKAQEYPLWLVDALKLPAALLPIIERSEKCLSLSPALEDMQVASTLVHRGSQQELRVFPPEVYCGPEWAVVGQNILRVSRESFRSRLESKNFLVGICLGGGANDVLLGECLRQLKAVDEQLQVLVAKGVFLSGLKSDSDRVVFLQANSSGELWEEMSKATIVITRAGITPFEASYVGVPSLLIDRGRGYCDTLVAKGVAEFASLADLDKRVAECLRRPEELARRFDLGQKLVDGGGASRIAELVVKLLADIEITSCKTSDGPGPGFSR